MTFSKFGCVKPIVSHCQELLVGFIPPLVLFIFLQDEFQKWGPQSTVWKAEYDSPLTKKMLCRKQQLHTLLTRFLILEQR